MQRIKIILFTSKELKGGSHPLMIRVTSNNERKYIYTGLRCMKEGWNKDSECASDKYRPIPDKGIVSRKEFDNQIQDLKERTEGVIKEFKKDKNYNWTISEFVNAYNLEAKDEVSALEFIDQRKKFFEGTGRIGTSECYAGVKSSFAKYLKEAGKEDLTFTELDYTLIEAYRGWLESRTKFVRGKRKTANTSGGIAVYLRTLRAAYRSFLEENHLSDKKLPFKNGIIPTGEPLHRALTKDEFKRLKEIKLDDSKLECARELFLVSFYLRGCNFSDLAFAKVSQVKDGIFTYKRVKTSRRKRGPKELKIRIPKQIIPIINRYMANKVGDEYLFNLISDKADTPQEVHNSIRNSRMNVTNWLKIIAHNAGIDRDHFSFYSARHTFATLSLREGADTREIMEALGHANIEQTETYLEAFAPSELDDIFEKRLKKL